MRRMSVLHQNSGGIGISIPSALEISLDPRDFPRASPSGNLSGLRKYLGRRGWISQYLSRFGGARIQSDERQCKAVLWIVPRVISICYMLYQYAVFYICYVQCKAVQLGVQGSVEQCRAVQLVLQGCAKQCKIVQGDKTCSAMQYCGLSPGH